MKKQNQQADTIKSLQRRIRMARGEEPGDLLLKGGHLVNVVSGEIYPADVLIGDGIIVGVGSYDEALEIIDVRGRFLVPGFLDGHVHVESSMLAPAEFARAVVARGTTAVIADPHEIANVLGAAGIEWLLAAGDNGLVDIYVMLPSCVPATHLETSGATLGAEELAPFIDRPRVIGLGEFMNFPAVAAGDPAALAKLALAQHQVIDGHAPGVTGRDLCAYVAAGIRSDHECVDPTEALEKMRLGMSLMVREGSATKNLEGLLPVVNQFNERACFFVTDDRHPDDLVAEGHIDAMVRRTVRSSGNILRAVRMATIHGFDHFGLRNRGRICPGAAADIAVVDDFHSVAVRHVVKDGRLVVKDQNVIVEPAAAALPPAGFRDTMHVEGLSAERLRLVAEGTTARVRILGVIPDQIVTRSLVDELAVREGAVQTDPDRDILKLAVIERHRGTGNVGLGFVQGLGIRGAIASTVAHDSHNLIVAGDTDPHMLRAAELVIAAGGGLALVTDTIEQILPLPVAGLMSDLDLASLHRELESLKKAARDAGSPLSDPFMTLAFLALPVIPELKLTDRGLVDVGKFDFVPLIVEFI